MKLISLNVWRGGTLWPQVLEFVQTHQAEVYCFQEAFHRTEPELPPHFRTVLEFSQVLPGYQWNFVPQQGDLSPEVGLVPFGNAIFSKYPMRALETIFFDVPYCEFDDSAGTREIWENSPAILQRALITIDNHEVAVGNLHGPVGYQGDEPNQRRQHMISHLIEFFSSHVYSLVVGDSNAGFYNPIWQQLIPVASCAFQSSPQTTFNMRQKTDLGYAQAAVDTLWVSPGIEVKSVEILDADISDHLPLVAEIELK